MLTSLKVSAIVLAMFCTSAAVAQETTTPPAPKPPAPPEAEKAKIEFVQMTMGGSVKGEIVIELNREKAPISVDNFLAYVDKKFYDGTIFHRVIPTFMIQGGGFTPDMQQKPTEPAIKNEWRNGLKNKRGTLAMARLGGNPDSATSQFFINVVDNGFLDQPQSDGAAYAVFGRVCAGMATVDAIKAVTTTTKGMHQNVPVDPVIIEKVARLTEEEAKKKIESEPKSESPTTPPTKPLD